jgi:hypothetical protein
VLKGYLDESVSGDKSVFGFSCVFSDGSTWEQLGRDWAGVIEKKNCDLIRRGKPPISRYHAGDCSTNQGEFASWSPDNHYAEKTEFFKELLDVLRRHPLNGTGYTLYTDDLRTEIPDAKNKEEGYGYALILQYIMRTIGSFMDGGQNSRERIALFNDRCDYDSVLVQTHKMMLERTDFLEKEHFLSIAALGWKDRVALQPADLIAYENMKETERHLADHVAKRPIVRRSLQEILALDTFAGRLEQLDRNTLRELKKYIDEDPQTRGIIDVIKVHR